SRSCMSMPSHKFLSTVTSTATSSSLAGRPASGPAMHFDEHARGARRAVLKALGAAALLAALSERRAEANDLRLGASAPPATLVTLDGQKLATSDLLGHVVILTFWATWCVPCRDELPLLSRYATEHAAQGLQVLGFSLDSTDDLKAVRAVAQSLKFPVG